MCACSVASRVQLFATLWTIAHQAPLSMGFSRQEYWSGFPFPSPGDLYPGSRVPALAGGFFTTGATWWQWIAMSFNLYSGIFLKPLFWPLDISHFVSIWYCFVTGFSLFILCLNAAKGIVCPPKGIKSEGADVHLSLTEVNFDHWSNCLISPLHNCCFFFLSCN